MKKFPVVFDLETKYTFRDFDDPKKLQISVLAAFDYATQKSSIYTEKDLNTLYPILENASYLVGFNINSFDIPVLQAYYPGNVLHFPTFDLLEDIRNKLGRRLALNDLLGATLGKKKTGHGLMAIDYYKEGRWDELKKYCLDDVMSTKELFDFGAINNEVYYMTEKGKETIEVNWKKYLESTENGSDMPLTLPF